jgi:hypothetical protein
LAAIFLRQGMVSSPMRHHYEVFLKISFDPLVSGLF